MKTSQCIDCQHADISVPGKLTCGKGHRPRFYQPRNSTDQAWGYKRKCADFIYDDSEPQNTEGR